MNIFKILGVYDDYEKCRQLFHGSSQTIIASDCIDRMIFIQRMYLQWIQFKTINSGNTEIMDIYDIISNELGDEYSINEFLRDYKYLVNDNRDCLPYHDNEHDDEDKTLECDISTCYIHNRLNRNRGRMTRNNHRRQQLFFINDNVENELNDDNISKSIFIQDILDGLHTFIYHTLRVRIEKFIKVQPAAKEEDDEASDDGDNDGFESTLFDAGIKAFTKFIENIRASSNRFARTQSASTANKFMTLSMKDQQQQQIEQHEQETKEEDDKTEDDAPLPPQKDTQESFCFIDYLLEEFRTSDKISVEVYDGLLAYLIDHSFDSDAVADDIVDIKRDPASSNILNSIIDGENTKAVLGDILYRFVYKRSQGGKVYDAGKRFYYWPYYMNREEEWNVLYIQRTGQPKVEGNSGYSLKDWYIEQKYGDLKQELLQNNIHKFSINQVKDLQMKAEMKLKNWIKDAGARKLNRRWCTGDWIKKCYGIAMETTPSMEHIMALLAYTNFTDHSSAFSSTFRRTSMFESDESLKSRHKEFHNWSKLLRELVECYGQTFSKVADNLSVLYHGVSRSLVFDSTTIKLHGPLSTTAEFEVAYTIFGAQGIVLDIKVGHWDTYFWNCNYWSTYVNENERFLIGGYDLLEFITIRDVPRCINFESTIKVLRIFSSMLTGYQLPGTVPSSKDVAILNRIINAMTSPSDKTKQESTSTYVHDLFVHFLQQQEDVLINWNDWRKHKIKYYEHVKFYGYGFKKFHKYFVDSSDSDNLVLKYSIFINIMPNLRDLTVGSWPKPKELTKSISIKVDRFVEEILTCIDLINISSYSRFSSFKFVYPDGDIDDFILKNNDRFLAQNWKLSRENYHNKIHSIHCQNNMLLIQKV